MHQVFIEGGLIRKLWDVEANAYRDHLLRLDHESRRNRFCGTIADDTIRSYAATARGPDVVLHGFFVDGVLRGVADLRIVRPLDLQEAKAAFSIECAHLHRRAHDRTCCGFPEQSACPRAF